MKGDGTKHFNSLGKYYGFGCMAKTNMNKSACSYSKVKTKGGEQ